MVAMRIAACLILLCACNPSDATGPAPAVSRESPPETAGSARPTMAPSAAVSNAAKLCDPVCARIERCDMGRCVPACPEGEIYIPATGEAGFTMGANLRPNVDTPHNVVLTEPFCMDATEVTVKAYKECVDADKCEPARIWGMWINYPKLPNHPVNKVHWNHAMTYCTWRDQSLPTEAQWEWAATGGDGRKWAWGNEAPTCAHADYTPGHLRGPSSDDGCHGGGTSPVGTLPKGDKQWPDGKLHDLSGNLWEWCLDNYKPWRPIETQAATDPLVLTSPNSSHVVRGGGWNRSGVGIRTHFRASAVVDYQVPGLGFRCVRNVIGSSVGSPPAASSAPAPPGRRSP